MTDSHNEDQAFYYVKHVFVVNNYITLYILSEFEGILEAAAAEAW